MTKPVLDPLYPFDQPRLRMLRCYVNILRSRATCDDDVDPVRTGDAPYRVGVRTARRPLYVDEVLREVADGQACQFPQPLLDVLLGEAGVVQRLRMVDAEHQQDIAAAVCRRH